MKMYGKRYLNRAIQRATDRRIETRDAILWEIDYDLRIARVKVQGSNELILAQFPQNLDKTPAWLKVGNAVRITHTSGTRSRVELSGHGSYIPTPVAGDAGPPMKVGPDAILEGIDLLSYVDTYVQITPGVYRINDQEYTVTASGLIMQADSTVTMGSDPVTMGDSGGVIVLLDPPPTGAGISRYDVVTLGAGGAVQVTKGNESSSATSAPDMPEPPADTVTVGYVLMYGGAVSVTQEMIDKSWEVLRPTTLLLTAPTENPVSLCVKYMDTGRIVCEDGITIDVTISDQYGHILDGGAGEGWTLKVIEESTSGWFVNGLWPLIQSGSWTFPKGRTGSYSIGYMGHTSTMSLRAYLVEFPDVISTFTGVVFNPETLEWMVTPANPITEYIYP